MPEVLQQLPGVNQASGAEPVESNTFNMRSDPKRFLPNFSAKISPEELKNYEAQIATTTKKREELQTKINKLSEQIDGLEKSRMSIRQMIGTAVVAAVAVTAAVALLAWVAGPLICGLALGALAFVAVGFILYQNDCNKQAQIEILKHLTEAERSLGGVNQELANAYSNLFGMAVTVNEQGDLITAQGKTVDEQLQLLTGQATQIKDLQQKNTELEKNLAEVQKAREDADRQVQEIQANTGKLKSSLGIIEANMAEKEKEIEGLRQTNSEQAEVLQKQTESMKAFVNGQRAMVAELGKVLEENKTHLDSLMQKAGECDDNITQQLEEIKKYVQSNFDAVNTSLVNATKAMGGLGQDGQELDPEKITQVQQNVTKAITSSVVRLGTMQEQIIVALTQAQIAIKTFQQDRQAKIAETQQALQEQSRVVEQIQVQCGSMKGKIEAQMKKTEEARAKLQDVEAKPEEEQNKLQGWAVGFRKTALKAAQDDVEKQEKQLGKLRGNLDQLDSTLSEAQRTAKEQQEQIEVLGEKNTSLSEKNEEIEQQRGKLINSNNALYTYIQNSGENLKAIKDHADQADQHIDAAAEAVSEIGGSKWGLLGTAFCAGGTATAASALSFGAVAVGGFAFAGALAAAFAAVCIGKAFRTVTG
ncbi:MAG: hypothetical protein LBK24_02820 [Puniceicoccales bacterium]|jgi:chromosome segregation ATPase|nr:hypothetical protein [Puniceicoccales bacterium]